MTNKTQSVLSQLVDITQQRKALKEQDRELAAHEELLRDSLKITMTQRGIRSQIDDASNVTATLVERKDLQIVDEEAVVASLRQRQALEKCLKLDVTAVKREYKTEPLAGVEEVTASYVQLKEAA